MCGICCLLICKTSGVDYGDLKNCMKYGQISHRGPDSSKTTEVSACDTHSLILTGHVLHLRGQLTSQPLHHDNGDLLLWNGEIFGGIEVKPEENDTEVLLQILTAEISTEHVMNTMASVQGPWSFIYWQNATQQLYFGRDMFGRRSLLWHLPQTIDDVFILSSVRIQDYDFEEVPSTGIFSLKIKDNTVAMTMYPRDESVWPGTAIKVKSSDPLQYCLQQILPPNFKFELSGTQVVPMSIPKLNNKELPGSGCMENKELPGSGCMESSDVMKKEKVFSYVDTKMKSSINNTDSIEVSNSICSVVTNELTDIKNGPSVDPQQILCDILQSDSTMNKLSDQLIDVLFKAVTTRVYNQIDLDPKTQPSNHCTRDKPVKTEHHHGNINSTEIQLNCSEQQLHQNADNNSDTVRYLENQIQGEAKVAILFSGGIDSAVITALVDRCLPDGEPVDLLNVAFEQHTKTQEKKKCSRLPQDNIQCHWNVPDRITGYTALKELNPKRRWNFVEVNVTIKELQKLRLNHIKHLLYPLETVLDDSIGCAVWFAARGCGILGNTDEIGKPYKSTAKVILCGMGADEQLAGYSRHRVKFIELGWQGLLDEIELEVNRISVRNLGRDDRIISDHGKESRFPFLDENVVNFLQQLPVQYKANLSLPRGIGEKLLLRLCALKLGLTKTATFPKRAIQFGSRIAKTENNKEKGSDKCNRLTENMCD